MCPAAAHLPAGVREARAGPGAHGHAGTGSAVHIQTQERLTSTPRLSPVQSRSR